MSKKPQQKHCSKTNIILANLDTHKLKNILELCNSNNIHYTFDKDYYSDEYYDVYKLTNDLILNNNKISIVYKKLIDDYQDFIIESIDDTNDMNNVKIENYKKF